MLDVPLLVEDNLRNGFWPKSRFTPPEVDRFQVDGTLREEVAQGAPF